MATNFKHLEFLPLDEENLIVNDNPESNLKSDFLELKSKAISKSK